MIDFKTDRIRNEWALLRSKNYPLYTLVESLAEYIDVALNNKLVLTSIYRSQKDQESIYGKGTKRTSPHMRWEAVDLRDRIYTNAEKEKIVAWLKTHYDKTNQLAVIRPAASKTVWLHIVPGQAWHFHLQYRGPSVMTFTEGMTISA